ncbi:MAG: isoleucine--tRNA ligase, partial [Candidatus Paceibacterota bacterium]
MYDFKKTEEDALKFWKDKKIYEKAKLKNKKGKKFYFLQGPPYTSGKLHIGHAWNNSMKDILLRFKRMNGLNVWDRAGYDMHGLPTENKVMKNLGLKDKDDIVGFGVEKFTKECTSFSVENAKAMDSDLQRLGIWLDYSDPYYPVRPVFIEGEWWMIKKAWEQKRLYKGKKIMHWCSECETSLAKHELEYENLKDKSIFLKFQIKDRKDEFLIVWTTTPWTIPFNLAIMVNPGFEYVKAKVGEEKWIIAKALVQQVMDTIGKEFKITETISGKKMEGMKYIHPLYSELKGQFDSIKGKNLHSVVLSKQYVTTEAGSGLVHCAPGCGPEDFEVGKEYGLLPFNQINEQGIFTGMGKFTGMIAKKEDYKFIKELEEKGALIGSAKVEHEYATCWRCHNPVVFRAIEQWFLKIEDLIPELLKSNEKVNWVPKWGKEAFDNWIGSLKDNSITRQRFWGTPVPIWLCPNGHVEVIGSIDELKKKAIGKVPEDLHRPMIDSVLLKCPECKKEMKRIEDVIDVWIDAGTLSWNCLYYPSREDYFKNLFPADFILEATEQIKLWFSMLSICSEVAMRKPCYKSVYMHGMILDYQGLKMSKSLGNVISPYEVIDKCGADILRYYMCEVAAGENINFSWENVKQKQRNINVLWNVKNYLIELASLLGKNPEKLKPKFGKEEEFILSRCNSTIKETTELFENYKLDETITKIESFFLELSRVYIQLVRDKVSLGSREEKETVLYAIYNSFINVLKMFAPVCPFITDSMYGELKEK